MAKMIPDGIFEQYYKFVDELYTNPHISEEATLYYVKRGNCSNCIPGHPNKYNGTGPISFNFGPCPVCNGKNYLDITTTEKIRLRLYDFKNREYTKEGNVAIDKFRQYVIGKIEDYTKLKQAEYFLFFSNTGYGDWKFTLDSEPAPFGFGSSQFKAFIKRL